MWHPSRGVGFVVSVNHTNIKKPYLVQFNDGNEAWFSQRSMLNFNPQKEPVLKAILNEEVEAAEIVEAEDQTPVTIKQVEDCK